MSLDKSLKMFVEQWKKSAPMLQKVRDDELRNSSPADAIMILSDVYEQVISESKSSPTSGFAEYQRILQKLRK